MASKKNGTTAERQRKQVVADDGLDGVRQAFEELTREPTPPTKLGALLQSLRTRGVIERIRRQNAWLVFMAAVLSVRAPNPKRDKWLYDTRRLLLAKATKNARVAAFVHALEEGDLPGVRDADPLLATLTAERFEAARQRVKPDRKASGATHVYWYDVAAGLALEFGALGFSRRTNESPPRARRRVAKAMRQAVARAG